MKHPRQLAIKAATEIIDRLESAKAVHKAVIVGSVRRGLKMVKDVEILYIPVFEAEQDLFGNASVNPKDLATEAILGMERDGLLTRRKNSKGHENFGKQIKLMQSHRGIPVDLFAIQAQSWWNHLVLRTGPKALCERIATLALKQGWRWQPFEQGFYRDGVSVKMSSEKAVFDFVGLPYREPEARR